MHGHGHADSAEHHGDEADEAKYGGGMIQALSQRRIALAVIHHLRVRQRRLDLFAHGHRI